MGEFVNVQEIIELLDLKPLTFEGGYYRETYRSQEIITAANLSERYKTDKSFCSAIYYLLTPDTRSILHRLPTDEIYHFYFGDPVTMLLLSPEGRGEIVTLGQNLSKGQRVQHVVQAEVWQGCLLCEGGRYALMGTTMAPGFDIGDFESAGKSALLKKYQDYNDLIKRLL